MNSRRLMSSMGAPPPELVYRTLSLPEEWPGEFMGDTLNCSELRWRRPAPRALLWQIAVSVPPGECLISRP